MDINEIRKEVLTEDAKMEIIADHLIDNAGINVVEIHNMSGTLSDEDFAKVQGDNCMIKASTQYFYKQFDAATLLRYGALPRLGVDKVIFESITIDKSTKGYEFTVEQYPAA